MLKANVSRQAFDLIYFINYIYTLLYSGDYNDNAESETIVLVLVLQW